MTILDTETAQQLSIGQHVQGMVGTVGWRIVKEKLDAKIMDLQMIGNVEGNTPEEKVTNMAARGMAVSILFEWLKNDVYGLIEQQNVASEALTDGETNTYIDR